MQLRRSFGAIALIAYLPMHFSFKNAWIEFLGYNSVPILIIAVIIAAPKGKARLAYMFSALGILLWTLGSIVATSSTFFQLNTSIGTIINVLYLTFYFISFFSFPYLLLKPIKLKTFQIIDALIVGLGSFTLSSIFFIYPLVSQFSGSFSSNLFPIIFCFSDSILVSLVIAVVAAQGPTLRGVILLLGSTIYAVTDFIFYTLDGQGQYTIGSLVDIGWLLAFLIIAESFWQPEIDNDANSTLTPVLVSLSVSVCATLLALIALQPTFTSHFVLIPALATLALALTRMAIALTQSRNIGEERILARTDELTGLPNRRRLVSELDTFMDKKGSLLLLDLDGFKPINDRYGHETGDKILQQVAVRFERAMPAGALLARLGGDEFGVLYEGGYDAAVEVALALKATLSYPFHIDDQDICLGVSVGVARNTGESDLLLRADNAMYKAKREGLGVYQL